MRKCKTLLKLISDENARFLFLAELGLFNKWTDEKFVCKKYKAILKKEIDIKSPKRFCEKIQYLKLYDYKDEYRLFVDKYEAKLYVSRLLGSQYVIPTIGVYDSFEDIDFTMLPKSFVIKCTHDSGGLYICKDKDHLDIDKARQTINKSLKNNFYYIGREQPYKHVKPRVIVEQYMIDSVIKRNNVLDKVADGLMDYKFYCFNGEPKFLYVSFANMKDNIKNDLISFYDLNWKKCPFSRADHDELPFEVERPQKLDEMIEVARKLAKNIPFMRVDLYYIDDSVYFSEMTLHPGSGYGEFYPEKWEYEIGSWICINTR